jgi:phosphatidylserine/phosphatidylglycerophosphate/cardiolipin synthase-like enzyme
MSTKKRATKTARRGAAKKKSALARTSGRRATTGKSVIERMVSPPGPKADPPSLNEVKVVCAAQLGPQCGSGMQLWSVAGNGQLFSTFQQQSNGDWEAWSPWADAQNLYALTAARNGKGELSLWALDGNGAKVHCRSQGQTSSGTTAWGGWSEVWTPVPNGAAPVPLQGLCACDAGPTGRQLWAIGEDGCLYSTYEQERLGGNWTRWAPWDAQPGVDTGKVVRVLAAARNGNGEVSLWALDTAGVLHCRSQIQGGATWASWEKGWSPVRGAGSGMPVAFASGIGDGAIRACPPGSSLGRALWAVGQDGYPYWTYETAAMGGGWTAWQQFPGPGNTVSSLSAARQSDGRIALWALSEGDVLANNVQKLAGGGWAGWEPGGRRYENLGFIDEIERTLARQPDKNEGVTYRRTSGDKFTLLDTPGLWGQGPQATGRGSAACNRLLSAITNVIGSATQILDIALLYNPHPSAAISAFPDGEFQNAICRGFEKLIASGRTSGRWPSIRILFGVPLGGFWRYARFPALTPKGKPRHTDLMQSEKRWLQQTIELSKKYKMADMKCPLQFAHGKSVSWNHTKIIVADDKIAITGGHNFWDDDYLGAAPVHDVSGVFEGPAARAARYFCDKLWTSTDGSFSLIDGVLKDKAAPSKRQIPEPNAGMPGGLEMLSLGRLGAGLGKFSITSNASVTARIVALCRAKTDIRISQQTLNLVFPRSFDFYTCLAIVRAVQAGVNVQIVLSGETRTGYEGAAGRVRACLQWLYLFDVQPALWDNVFVRDRCKKAPPRDRIDDWADLSASADTLGSAPEGDPDAKTYPALKKFNSKLKVATLYYSDNSQAANHSKVYIIDEDCFYVGSDNFYPSGDQLGLQEFGYLIEDKSETKKFIAEYWDKLWQYSRKHQL